MNYKNILFDLDGTLTDPAEGITNSVMHALSKFGITITDRRSLYTFIGPPLTESFMRYFDMDKETADIAVGYYREYFSRGGLFENIPYDGIIELLEALKANGKTVIMATSKPQVFARKIAEHFGFIKYFDFICGSELDGTRIAKAEVIEYALDALKIADREATVMIGDRMHDIVGAKKTGLKSIGVLYGYGSLAELTEYGADMIAATVQELKEILL